MTALIQLRDTAAADGCESYQSLLDHYITMQYNTIYYNILHIKVKVKVSLFVTYTIIQSIISSEM